MCLVMCRVKLLAPYLWYLVREKVLIISSRGKRALLLATGTDMKSGPFGPIAGRLQLRRGRGEGRATGDTSDGVRVEPQPNKWGLSVEYLALRITGIQGRTPTGRTTTGGRSDGRVERGAQLQAG